jgi:hypothetical protein
MERVLKNDQKSNIQLHVPNQECALPIKMEQK